MSGHADAGHAVGLEHAGFEQLDGCIKLPTGVGAPPPSTSICVTPASAAKAARRSSDRLVAHEAGRHMGNRFKAGLRKAAAAASWAATSAGSINAMKTGVPLGRRSCKTGSFSICLA